MVPSLTETLLTCGVNVVGRTRFCIEPVASVKSIAVVGGTKDINWESVKALQPDLLIFDQEENPKAMADQASYPWHATHITAVGDLAKQMQLLAERFAGQQRLRLLGLADRWQKVSESSCSGLGEAILDKSVDFSESKPVLYLIWQKPFMAVSKDTFIGSMLEKLGLHLAPVIGKYPEIDIDQVASDVQLLFSTEPFPFEKLFQKTLADLGARGSSHSWALVDGQRLSWFGVRSLEFLESRT